MLQWRGRDIGAANANEAQWRVRRAKRINGVNLYVRLQYQQGVQAGGLLPGVPGPQDRELGKRAFEGQMMAYRQALREQGII